MNNDSNIGLQSIITDPNSFFRESDETPGLLVPTGIVLLVAILATIAALPRANLAGELAIRAAQGPQVNQSMAETVSTLFRVIPIVGAFLGVVITWGLYAIVFHLIARLVFDGTGSLTSTFAYTGWGFLPLVLGKFIRLIVAYYVFSGVTLPQDHQAAQNAFEQLQSDPTLLVAGVFGLGMTVWSGVLWTYAMAHLHALSRWKAGITVGIPLLIAILLRLNGLL